VAGEIAQVFGTVFENLTGVKLDMVTMVTGGIGCLFIVFGIEKIKEVTSVLVEKRDWQAAYDKKQRFKKWELEREENERYSNTDNYKSGM
jgi:hypothetical protein